MGIQPPVAGLSVRQSERRLPKPQPGQGKRLGRRPSLDAPSAVVLPAEAQRLKTKILETHTEKSSRFSLSHMKRVVIPPVAVPANMNGPKSLATVVGGKNVPYTRRMWENRKRKVYHLDMVDEYVQLFR